MATFTTIGLENFILASGALGTAAMGIAEGFKTTKWTPLGLRELMEELN